MVTGDEEIKYGYLLDPCFQIVNTAGKPLTQGWIEVYIAGTRNKYYCSSDFAGTLHPFKIPLDSLGSNIILADVDKSYDVYVYNRFGNLSMSRYNITPGKGGAGGSVSGSGIAEHWIGKNGQNTSIPAGSDTALKLPLSYEYEGSFIDRINENRTAFYLKEGLYLVQAVVNFKQSDQSLTNEISQVDVFTRSDDTPEDMSFNRDMAGPDSSDDSHCLKVSFIRCVKEDDEVSQIVLFKVNTPNAWSECYLQNVQIARLSSGGAGAGGRIYEAGEYIAIDDETNTISVTGIEPENYATHDEVEQAIESATSAFITSADLPDLSEYATEQWVLDKHYITSADIPDIPDDLVTSAELAQTSGLIEQDIADLTSAISESLAEKMDKSSSADFYPRYDNPEGYLTSIPSEYVTESEMSGYVQDHTSGFITSADLPDVSDMATKTWVTDQHYITSADVPPQVEYSAGDNIDITNHVVSVTDTSLLLAGDNVSITPSGNDYIISAQVPETSAFVTDQEMNDAIQSATSAFITSADLPDVSDMATKTWVGEQGYLTSIPSEYVTETELDSAVSGKADKSEIPSLVGYATEQYVQDQTSAFITSADLPDVSDMATQTWVSEQGYLTSIPSEYVTETELESELSGKADTSAIPDVRNFVTQEDIDASVSGKMDATESSAFYPMSTNPSGYLVSSDLNGYATETWVGQQGYLTSVPSEYVTETELNSAVSGKADKSEIPSLQGYATESYVQDQTSAFITSADLPSEEEVQFEELDLSSFVDSAYVTDYVASQTSGKQDTLTFGYDASDKINAINGSAIAGGGSSGPTYSAGSGIDITNDVISIDNTVALKTDIPSLNGYATEQYVDSHTSGKLDTSAYTAPVNADWTSSAGLSEILNKPESTRLLAGTGITISESGADYVISSDGGSVPEGVMVESGLQYNAVGEISGYGESAIAQYGAEKQWLVHDDTIVHMSNSAQYAFGVNISATSQLMGVDQTVLWEDSAGATTAFSLSEPVSGFDQLKIRFDENGNGNRFGYMWCNDTSMSVIGAAGLNFMTNDTDDGIHINAARFTVNGNELTMNYCNKKWIPLTPNTTQPWGGSSTLGNTKVYKIVGICRKQSN